MEKKIKCMLKRWESSLITFGKIDQWKINDDFSMLGNFIASRKFDDVKKAIRDCRDQAISETINTSFLLYKIQVANSVLDKHNCDKSDCETRVKNVVSQSKKYSSTTKKLYKEKLRFKNGESLCNVDISLEDGKTSRKIRRIVEKRMCQAYHRLNRNHCCEDNRNRHYTKRATSFQLHNLGNIEYTSGMRRTDSTHWKKVYDVISNSYVYKSKQGYSSYEEADKAAKLYMLRHPEDKKEMTTYKCRYCDKWHIGHKTLNDEKKYLSMVTFSECVS